MSEDRLDSALEEMKQEAVDAATLEAARARVWNTLTNTAVDGCAEFRPDLPRVRERNPHRRQARAAGRPRQPLHRVPHRAGRDEGRTAGDRHAAAIVFAAGGVGEPSPPPPRWCFSVLYLGRDTLDAWMAPGGPRATVVSASGGLYRLSGGALEAGAAIGEKERIRTGPGAHAVLRLADGSTVDVNERTELFVTAAWSGQADSSPARRRHRPGGEAAPRAPARADA